MKHIQNFDEFKNEISESMTPKFKVGDIVIFTYPIDGKQEEKEITQVYTNRGNRPLYKLGSSGVLWGENVLTLK